MTVRVGEVPLGPAAAAAADLASVESFNVRKLLVLLIPALLLLSACSGTSQDTATPSVLDSVKVTAAAKGKEPKVEFDKPLDIQKQTIKKVTDGDGPVVTAGQTVSIRVVAFNAEDGSTLGETYSADKGEDLDVTDALKKGNKDMYDALVGTKVGSQLAMGAPAVQAQPETGQKASPATLLVFSIESVKDAARPMAQDKVKALEKAGKLPTVKFDSKHKPTITVPKKTDPPKELAVQVLKKGKGAKVTADQTVKANYLGVTWSDGKKFDSSYDKGKAAEFALAQVIKGWTLGLTGQTVGSTVVLSIPSDLAYGDSGSNGQPKGALVFVVDILDAK